MSKENVRLFYEKVSQDRELQAQLQAVGEKLGAVKPEESQMDALYQAEVIPLARAAGFDFTLSEQKEYFRELGKPGVVKLTDDELAAVAGGGMCVCVAVGLGANQKTCCNCVGYGWGHCSRGFCLCLVGGGGDIPDSI